MKKSLRFEFSPKKLYVRWNIVFPYDVIGLSLLKFVCFFHSLNKLFIMVDWSMCYAMWMSIEMPSETILFYYGVLSISSVLQLRLFHSSSIVRSYFLCLYAWYILEVYLSIALAVGTTTAWIDNWDLCQIKCITIIAWHFYWSNMYWRFFIGIWSYWHNNHFYLYLLQMWHNTQNYYMLICGLVYRFTSRNYDRKVRDSWSLLSIEVLHDRTRVHNWSTFNIDGRVFGWDPLYTGSWIGIAPRKKDSNWGTMGW